MSIVLLLLQKELSLPDAFRRTRNQFSLDDQERKFVLYEWPQGTSLPDGAFELGVGPNGEQGTVTMMAFRYGPTDTGAPVVIVRPFGGAGTQLASDIAKFVKSGGIP